MAASFTAAIQSTASSIATASAPKRRRLSRANSSGGSGSAKRRCLNTPTPQKSAVGSPDRRADAGASRGASSSAAGGGTSLLSALADGPYLTVAGFLSAGDLCRVDACCRLASALNGLASGPWQGLGDRAFRGVELSCGNGVFLSYGEDAPAVGTGGCVIPASASSWKRRFQRFRREVSTFSPPFGGALIDRVEHPDEVAYCSCRLRTDLLAVVSKAYGAGGVYFEVEVLANADNLSLAAVDFEGGGRSSLTFSPETGAVLRERKVRELPRAIEGTYIHLLPAAPAGRRFEGSIGLYFHGGHIAFFRRWASSTLAEREDSANPDQPESGAGASPGAWETTGFCTDLTWAEGCRLSLCLAFRDEGAYRVRVTRIEVGGAPPLVPQRSTDAYRDDKWSLLYGDDDHPLAI